MASLCAAFHAPVDGRGVTAMTHKFKPGQMVRLNTPGFTDARTSSVGLYEVIRLMPADQSGEYSYRIKSPTSERAARESELQGV